VWKNSKEQTPKKNAPAEIKSENHAYHFLRLRMGLSKEFVPQDKTGDNYLDVMKRLTRIAQIRPQNQTQSS